MKTIINTIAVTALLTAASASAEVSKPYGVFNPLSLFNSATHKPAHKVDSAFYNYGNQGYEFVVEAMPILTPKLPQQLASLSR